MSLDFAMTSRKRSWSNTAWSLICCPEISIVPSPAVEDLVGIDHSLLRARRRP